MHLDDVRRALTQTRPNAGHVHYEPDDGHNYGATFTPDVRLTVAWGGPPLEQFEVDWPGQYGWLTGFDRPMVSRFQVDVRYCGALVERHFGVRVSGPDGVPYALLPEPHPSGPTTLTCHRPGICRPTSMSCSGCCTTSPTALPGAAPLWA